MLIIYVNLESLWNQNKSKKVDNSKEISWYKHKSDTIVSDKVEDTNRTIIGENIKYLFVFLLCFRMNIIHKLFVIRTFFTFVLAKEL